MGLASFLVRLQPALHAACDTRRRRSHEAVEQQHMTVARIVGFHQDDEGHWVAKLSCGHQQHMRHDPPWQNRPWVLTSEGRQGLIGTEIPCNQCVVSSANTSSSPRHF